MDVRAEFDDRVQEIYSYLDLLDAIDTAVRGGSPKIGTATVTTQQQRMLYSSVYLLLYNLTEATVTWCLKAITHSTTSPGIYAAGHLSDPILKEWVKTIARTNVSLNEDNRLSEIFAFCKLILGGAQLSQWSIGAGGGGNWDDLAIEDVAKRLGVNLTVSKPALTAIKRRVRDDLGPLGLVKQFRNKLAHGEISFTDCGLVTPSDLRTLADSIIAYLGEAIDQFVTYVKSRGFLASAAVGGTP